MINKINAVISFMLLQIISIYFIFSQGHVESRLLLDKVSKNLLSKENINFEFTYKLENSKERVTQEIEGDAQISGEKYKLNFMDIEQIYDGSKTYTIVPENEEINIEAGDGNSDLMIKPTNLITFYTSGFGYEWDIKQIVKGRTIQYIKLLPIDESSDVKYLLVGVDINNLNLFKIIEIGKNGTNTTLKIKSQSFNISLPEKHFNFDSELYKDYFINEDS
ncbi:MAG: LolA family protein [Flavobacteriaceae bacterium]|tara:strand:+ start:6986 stop:7645 length:660 start_codon:yes stop_codon:yes gene_type:complete